MITTVDGARPQLQRLARVHMQISIRAHEREMGQVLSSLGR